MGLHPSFLVENLYLQGKERGHPWFLMMKIKSRCSYPESLKESEFSEILLPFGGSKIQGSHFVAVWKSLCLSFLSKGSSINLSHGAAVRFKIMNPAWRPAQGTFGNIYRFDVLGKLIAVSSFGCPPFEAIWTVELFSVGLLEEGKAEAPFFHWSPLEDVALLAGKLTGER